MKTSFLTFVFLMALNAADHKGVVKLAGVPVPGATVTVQRGDQKMTAVTDDTGAYTVTGLAEGQWSVRVEMLTFVPQEKQISADGPPVEWDMKLMSLAEIQAESASVKDSSRLSVSFSSDKPAAEEKPKVTEVPAAFKKTELKANAQAPAAFPQDNEPPRESASDSLLVNGSVNNAAASAMGQSAAFGNMRKGRGPRYNGAISATLGNSALDARPYSLTGQQLAKPAYSQFQGQATFGGPLVIPHLIPLTRSPINFFLNYQWIRNRTGSTQSSLMPTETERNGELSQSAIDPAIGAPFPGNRIPISRISPQARALLDLYPLPNFNASSRFNYQAPIFGRNDSDNLQARVNKTVTARNQINAMVNWQRASGYNTNVFGFRDATSGNGINSSINWSHRFGQRVFSNVRLEYSRSSNRLTPYFAGLKNVSGDAGITGNNQEAENWGPPSLSFASGIETLNDGVQSYIRNQTAGIGGGIFWNHGSHNVQVGGGFRRLQTNTLAQQNPRGSFSFTGAAAGSDFAGFLLGIPDTSGIAFGNADKYFRSGMYDAYINDDWRWRPGVTFTLGLRWDYASPITEKYGRLVNLDIAPGFRAVTPVVGRDLQPDRNNIQPRLAVAWRPFLASSLIIRAGYGVYYDTSVYQWIANRMAQQAPLSKSLSVQNTPDNPLTLADGFKASSLITQNTFAVDPNLKIGYAQNWNASVQRDLPGSLVMIASYLGVKGTRAQQQFLPNTVPIGVAPCLGCPTGFAYLTSNGNSTRHAGQLQLRRRLHHGFTASLQYTWSKSIDNASLGGKNQSVAVIAQDWLNLDGERGLSNFDQRHLANFQIQYTTGMGVRGGTLLSGWRGLAFKGWTVTSNIVTGSGLPLTPIYTAAVIGTGVTGSIRPDFTGADLYAAPSGRALNPAALSAPQTGRWGNAGRNSITGPSQFSLNGSISRTFNDGFFEFRLDANNALNTVVFPNWVTNINSAQFGLPTTANAMRTLTASVRFRIF